MYKNSGKFHYKLKTLKSVKPISKFKYTHASWMKLIWLFCKGITSTFFVHICLLEFKGCPGLNISTWRQLATITENIMGNNVVITWCKYRKLNKYIVTYVRNVTTLVLVERVVLNGMYSIYIYKTEKCTQLIKFTWKYVVIDNEISRYVH